MAKKLSTEFNFTGINQESESVGIRSGYFSVSLRGTFTAGTISVQVKFDGWKSVEGTSDQWATIEDGDLTAATGGKIFFSASNGATYRLRSNGSFSGDVEAYLEQGTRRA